jgi:NADP-dependent aldehyde dehydrogenase
MGSLNPLVVLPGVIKERGDQIAQGLAGSILLGAGQFCTKPGLVLLVGQADGFVQALAKHIQSSPAFTMLNQGLRNSFCDRTTHFTKTPGVKTHVAGQSSGHAGAAGMLFETTAEHFAATPALREEAFGPAAVVVTCRDADQALAVAKSVGGSLTGTVHAGASDAPADVRKVIRGLESVAGRVILNGYPTGVEVCHAMVHGGPYPATTDPNSTSVGTGAIRRFARMVAFQDLPDSLLPPELQNANPLGIWRTVNGDRTKQPIAPTP